MLLASLGPGENCWANVPYKAIGRVWRALREQQAIATLWCSVCATAHLPNVVLVEACGPALSELVGSSENCTGNVQ